jgi:ketosteroid isomerase-like protein
LVYCPVMSVPIYQVINQPTDAEALIERAYAAFNARDIETALSLMHPQVEWPNGMEGGTVYGHSGIRDYWTRQWSLIDPSVTPTRFTALEDGRTLVDVHQVVRDLDGNVLKDARIQHVYQLQGGFVKAMEIRETP